MRDLPDNIGIIMDGNRRWSNRNLVSSSIGYKKGAETLRKVINLCSKYNINNLSAFAFSTENWLRPKAEVNLLFSLIERYLNSEIVELNTNNVRVNFVGKRENLSKKLINLMDYCQELTKNNQGLKLNIAINYGGRDDILSAVKKIILDATEKNLSFEMTPDLFESYLYSKDIGNIDLLIRTGGEQRISNFFLWQTIYSELYFCNSLWPEFSEDDFFAALEFYSKRKNRIGSSIEQNKINE